jgi:hypothetical protein
MNFKEYLIEKINNTRNEADMVLHQIFNNVDESHVDYTEERLDFNVGIMVKRSGYSRLYVTIFNSDVNSVRLAENIKKNGFTIVINTTDYPERNTIDTFLSNKATYGDIKKELETFIEKYNDGETEFVTAYEDNKQINTDEHFEKLYREVVDNMKRRVDDYKQIAADLNAQLDATADEGKKQTLVRALETLKDEHFGNTFKKFKKIAGETVGIDLTRFEKDYKKKFDTRLEDFYEYIVKL